MSTDKDMVVEINIVGCDDRTTFNIMVDQAELELLRRLETESKAASTYNCQPIIEVGAPF